MIQCGTFYAISVWYIWKEDGVLHVAGISTEQGRIDLHGCTYFTAQDQVRFLPRDADIKTVAVVAKQ